MIKINARCRHQMTDCNIIYSYIHGGKGIVTLEAPSGKSHMYAFYKPRNSDEFPNDVIFVYAVHNLQKLFYVGMIEQDRFRVTRHSRFLEDNEIVKGASYIMKMAQGKITKSPMKLYHEGICCRCGRPLTHEKSVKQGIGSRCNKLLMF